MTASQQRHVQRFLDLKRNRIPNADARAIALEGLWSVRHAARAGLSIEAAFVCPALVRGDESPRLLAALAEGGTPVLEIGERMLRRMVDRDGPDGLAAIARLPPVALDAIDVGDSTRVLVADNVELAGNLGTLIRCADGAGASAVLLTERRVRVTHPLVVKASMGTLFTMPVVSTSSREQARDWLRRHGCTIVAADPEATCSYRDAPYSGPVAIVVGSERYGLAPFWRTHADVVVSIPMLGVADSLNVGHAAALLLYEALAQR
jgi:TrmH family RNA methyltransferase